MRTKLFLSLLGAHALFAGACKWTEFDDLEGETWVASVEKPNLKSTDYGVAIQRGADSGESGSSGTLAVIGAAPGTYSELAFDGNGGSSLKTNSLVLGDQGITTLEPTPPLLLASPASGEVALVTTGDSDAIVVATGTHTLLLRQLNVGTNNTTLGALAVPNAPDAATYMQPKMFDGIDATPPPEPLVAAGDIVFGTVYGLPVLKKQPACKLTDGATAISIRALGVVRNDAGPDIGTDDVLVWNGTDGKLHRYSVDVFNGCGADAFPPSPATRASKASGAVAFQPGKGSQILTIDENRVLLQGHQDIAKGDDGFLQVYDSNTLMPLGVPVTEEGLRTAAIIKVGTDFYALAGYPTSTSEEGDSTRGGVVQVFKIAAGSGIESKTPAAKLHDAQPESNQQFGRGIVALPYNGKQVIAVAADNEIFVYFRANQTDGTPLYDETRQGR